MPFTIQDCTDLARLLVEHPEWRLEFRRLILSEELLSLPEIVEELAAAQRCTEERVEELAAAQRRTEERVARLEERVDRLEERVVRLEEIVQDLIEQMKTLVEQVRSLTEAQHRMSDTLASLKGQVLEINYRHKARAFLGSYLRRLQVVDLVTVEDTLEAALTPGEFRDLLRLDLLLKGSLRERTEASEIWLAVEVSAVVDQTDVDRAERQAGLLRKAGFPALPVAAGEEVTRGAEDSALLQKVVLVQDGRVSFWEEALETWMA